MRRMSKEIHKRSYDAAVKELSELMENREMLESELEAVDSKILKLQWAVRGVGNLCNANPETEYPHLFPESASPDIGFTDAIREVLQTEPGEEFFTPVNVRTVLEHRGFDLKKYKNPLASIHTILKRLEKSGQARTRVMEGKVRYTGVRK